LEELLIHQALVRTYDLKLIQTAAKLLHRTKGEYRIAELADYCEVSVRQLERGFRHVIGTSPKVFARTLRFQEAQRRLMFDPDADLTALAYECGYFDQAHFIKDFKAFAGYFRGVKRDLLNSLKPETAEDYLFRGLSMQRFRETGVYKEGHFKSDQAIEDINRAIEMRDTVVARAFRSAVAGEIAARAGERKIGL